MRQLSIWLDEQWRHGLQRLCTACLIYVSGFRYRAQNIVPHRINGFVHMTRVVVSVFVVDMCQYFIYFSV